MITARHLVSEGVARLEAAGVPEAKIKMEWWVSEILGVPRESLDTTFPDPSAQEKIEPGIIRLEQHEPLQYIIGHTPFLHINVLTDRRALIPRPETEELVMRAMACRALWSRGNVCVADVGTGTGCIAIALATSYASARFWAFDCSSEALKLARLNAERAGVGERILFRKGDLLEGIQEASLDAVISNPPYIARAIVDTLEHSVRKHEPLKALDGGVDGLCIIRRLAAQAFTSLKIDGRIWLEIGDEQGRAVKSLMSEAGFRDVEISRDMYGQERFVEGIK